MCATFSDIGNELGSFNRGERLKTSVGMPDDGTKEDSSLLRRSGMIGERVRMEFGKEEDEKGKYLVCALLAQNTCSMLTNVGSTIPESLEVHNTDIVNLKNCSGY